MADGLPDADLTKAGLEVAKGLGGYLAKIVGSVPEDAIGRAGGDWLSHSRKRNLAKLEADTAAHMENIAAGRRTDPSPSVVIPLLQAAADKSRKDLQALWAALFANAMIDGGGRVRRVYFDLVRQMEPADVKLFGLLANYPKSTRQAPRAPDEDVAWLMSEAATRGVSGDELEIASAALVQAGCATQQLKLVLTARGRSLWAACMVE